MRRAATFALAVPCFSLALYTGACSSNDDPHDASPLLADVFYEPHDPSDPHEPVNGGPTDEALDAIVEATPVEDPTRGAGFDSPAPGSSLPSDPPATFTWREGAGGGIDAGTGLRFAPPPPAVPGIRALFGPERAAFAHNAPYNGTAYLVVFKSGGDDKLLRVFTSGTSYTPDADAWAKLKGASGSIAVSVLTGRFTNNVIDSDGGPFLGPTLTFTIAK